MYRIFTEFYRICHATFRIMKIHEESELCITNATFQNYDSADINNHPHKHPINTNKTCFFYIYSWELNLSLFMKIQLPVKVEVCVLDIFTQEQYHVKSLPKFTIYTTKCKISQYKKSSIYMGVHPLPPIRIWLFLLIKFLLL